MPLLYRQGNYSSETASHFPKATQLGSSGTRTPCSLALLLITMKREVKVLAPQSCPTLFDPMDCSPPGSSIYGVLQARILEWVAIPFSRGFLLTQGLNPSLPHCQQILYHVSHQGNLGLGCLNAKKIFYSFFCVLSFKWVLKISII